MGTIVDTRIPTAQFALSEAFGAVPDASLEAVHVVAPRNDSLLPYLWATAPDTAALDEALRSDETTEEVTRLVEDDGRVLYQIKWCSEVRVFLSMLVERQGTLLDAQIKSRSWQLRILFPDKDAMSAFYDFCQMYGTSVDINRVHDLRSVVQHGGTRLSKAQYEALTEALDSDYYSVPRGTTLVELSDRLGVSHQAVSERLRRGHQALLESNLHDVMMSNCSIS
ncbi:MAG: bacterio-opsin activator domain-containing protein [Halorientalis sp.]